MYSSRMTWTGYYRGRLATKLRRLHRVGDPPQLPCFARLPSFASASFRKSRCEPLNGDTLRSVHRASVGQTRIDLLEGKSFALAVCANFVKSDAPIPFGFAPTAQRPKIALQRRI